MAREKGEIKFWFTTKTGRHIPVFEGETKADVVKRLKEKTFKSERKSMKETAQKVKSKKEDSETVEKNKAPQVKKVESKNKNASNEYKSGMSKEERKAWLENAPVGTKISGLYSKRTGNEISVEKQEGYHQIYGGVGAGTKIKETYWTIEGSKTTTPAKTLREAEEGTNKYYEFRTKSKKESEIQKAKERADKLNNEEDYRDSVKKSNKITKKNGKMQFKDKEVPELDTKDAGYINVTNDKGEVYDKVKDSFSSHLENGKLSKEREKVHAQIIEDYFKDKTPLAPGQKKVAYFTGGGGASGKGQFSGDDGKNVERFYSQDNNPLIIDPDVIKGRLAEADGKTLDAWLTGYYHEESSALAKQIYATALLHGYPVMYDGTATGGGIFKLLEAAKDAGYSTEMNFLFSDWNTVRKNSLARYEKTGRFVPPEQVFGAHQKAFGSVEKLKDVVDDFTLWDNAERKMRKVGSGGKDKKFNLLNQQSYDRFSKSRAEFTLSDEAIDAYMDEADKITAMLEKKIKAGK
jgi:predicted ABC-type ATPase